MLSNGDVFAGYRIVRLLGAGGMGEVYLAQHPRLSRQDALKVLPAELTADQDYAERFRREADLTASLWHPAIVGVHDCGEFDGRLWISMDFVDGSDTARLLDGKPGGLPLVDVLQIVASIADALDFAHQRGLLHRDVKPANILISDGGEPRRIVLADFGIGREINRPNGLTATNMTLGTVAYAAPEQLMGEPVDGRADQYALAATVYHLLAGKPVFEHSNPAVVISRHLNQPPPASPTNIVNFPHWIPCCNVVLPKLPPTGSTPALSSQLRCVLRQDLTIRFRSAHRLNSPECPDNWTMLLLTTRRQLGLVEVRVF